MMIVGMYWLLWADRNRNCDWLMWARNRDYRVVYSRIESCTIKKKTNWDMND